MSSCKSLNVLNYPVFTESLNTITLTTKTTINTINQYSYCIAEEDALFKKTLKESDILLPDGVGIVIAAKTLYKESIKKIAGADLHAYLLERLNKEQGSCFYMGASEETLQKIKERFSCRVSQN